MAGSGYHKIGDQMAVHSLNQIFGRKLDLNYRSVSAPRSAQSNEIDDYYTQPVCYTRDTSGSPGYNNNKRSRKAEEIERVISEIIPGYKVLVLLRGLPGSGKSTLAKSILERTIGYNPETVRKQILSTDDFFIRNGVYKYEPQQISEAHSWNHQRAFNVISKGYSPVIIDNTNTQMWEMKAYASMATDFGYILEILEPDTHWCYNERELEKRNTHGVPKLTIQNMLDRYEKNVTPLKLLTAYGFQYKLQKPPQYRLHPPIEAVSSSNSKLNKNKATFVEVRNSSKPQPSLSVLNKPTPSTSVDDILMRTDDSSMLKAPVLTPMNQTAKIKQSTSLFDNINAWGIDEKALRSWNLVTPVEVEEMDQISSPIIIDDTDDDVIETQEMSTSTDSEDFYVLNNLPTISGQLPAYKILLAYNRDINKNTPVKKHLIPKKTMIHKSCLTVDYLDDHQLHLDNLSGVFPNVTPRTIKYWYEKCNRDFDCTMELLLHESDEFINIVIEENEAPVAPVKPTTPEESDCDSSDSNAPPPTPHSKNKRKNNNSSSDEYQDLKKHIESKITISNDHYSEHLLKVKQCKYGPTPKEPISVEIPDNDSDDKTDSDELEWEFVTAATPSCSKNSVEPAEPVDIIEMNIGNHFVKQLEDRFGDPNLTYPKGFQPVIQIPETLARQLYTFYIESVYQQMDAQNAVMEDLVREDEDFAKKLQESEEKVNEIASSILNQTPISDKTPTEIPDIMREQKELSKRQKEADKWKEDTPDTLAARLTRNKLFKAFPLVDKDTLVEILHAHGNNYKETVDTLLASTTENHVQGDIESIRNPPLNEDVVQELWDAHNSCAPVIEAQAGNPRTAVEYREEANRHLEKRTKLYEKSQEYFQRGMREVAQYYCGLAAKQTRQYEQFNSLAATAFLDEHSKRREDCNTLDLHFLYVKEAIPHLDIFLDRNINLLRASSTKSVEYLHIITGRGKNSSNGIAKIRPAVISRLKERKISYNQPNPGLLKIKITKGLKVTNDL